MTSSNGNIFRVTGPLCGEFTGPGEFHTKKPVTRSFDVFFDLRLNKRLSKQPWGWWFETSSWSLWRQCNDQWPNSWPSTLHIVRRSFVNAYRLSIANWTPRNNFQQHFNQNKYILLIHEITFDNGVRKMVFFFRPQCVNSLWPSDAIWQQRYGICTGNGFLPDGNISLDETTVTYL